MTDALATKALAWYVEHRVFEKKMSGKWPCFRSAKAYEKALRSLQTKWDAFIKEAEKRSFHSGDQQR